MQEYQKSLKDNFQKKTLILIDICKLQKLTVGGIKNKMTKKTDHTEYLIEALTLLDKAKQAKGLGDFDLAEFCWDEGVQSFRKYEKLEHDLKKAKRSKHP